MSFFQHQSEVVERYLDALRCDPHAVPPQDLDPDTARILRAIVAVHSSSSTELSWESPNIHEAPGGAEQRVWDRVMFAVLAPSELEPTYLNQTGTLHCQPAPVSTNEVIDALPVPPIFPATSIYAPVMPSLPLVQRKQRLDFSLIAGMLIGVFLITGLLVQHDALTTDTPRYATPFKAEMAVPALDNALIEDNPELFVRYQPAETLWAGLPLRSRTKVEVSALSSSVMPVSPNKRYPE